MFDSFKPLRTMDALSTACSGCAEVQRGSIESNLNQTALFAACLGCAEVRKGSNESNHDQTTLTAACSDSALVRRGLNESNTSCLLRFGEAQEILCLLLNPIFCFNGCPYLIFLQNGSGGNESFWCLCTSSG